MSNVRCTMSNVLDPMTYCPTALLTKSAWLESVGLVSRSVGQVHLTSYISHLTTHIENRNTVTLGEVIFVAVDEDFPGLCSIRRANDPVALHCIQKAGCTAISDAEASLKDRC